MLSQRQRLRAAMAAFEQHMHASAKSQMHYGHSKSLGNLKKLPPELRLSVYSYAFSFEGPIQYAAFCQLENDAVVIMRHKVFHSPDIDSSLSTLVSLALTSKAISQEALPVFFETATFSLLVVARLGFYRPMYRPARGFEKLISKLRNVTFEADADYSCEAYRALSETARKGSVVRQVFRFRLLNDKAHSSAKQSLRRVRGLVEPRQDLEDTRDLMLRRDNVVDFFNDFDLCHGMRKDVFKRAVLYIAQGQAGFVRTLNWVEKVWIQDGRLPFL